MGLLDDAIREHLDLQRRRGADPTEVERAEREALGPVHRAQAAQDAELDERAEFEDEAGLEDEFEDEAELDHPTQLADPPPSPGAFDHDHEPDGWSYEEPPPSPEPELPMGPETALHEPVFEDDPLTEPPAGATPPPHPAGGETVQYDVESAPGLDPPDEAAEDEHPEESAGPEPPAAAADGEDVLEETPEFLQDTPDHDRLWFEQRPPKDFDFDG